MSKGEAPTDERRDEAADRVAARRDDLQRLVFGELQQQQVAPSSADPESCGALQQQGLHTGPGRRLQLASAARVTSVGGRRGETSCQILEVENRTLNCVHGGHCVQLQGLFL